MAEEQSSLPFDIQEEQPIEQSAPVSEVQKPIEASPQLPEVTQVYNIIEKAKEYLPKMAIAHDKGIEMLMEFGDEIQEDEREDAVQVAGIIASAYDKIVGYRMQMTKPLDELKDFLMKYERPFDAKNEKSEYAKHRRKIGALDQKKIEEKKRIAEEAAKKKAKADALVDMGTKVLQNLNDLILNKTKAAESESKKYFDLCTLENFDTRAEAYKKMKPSLKPDDYAACFKVAYDTKVFTEAEYTDFVVTMKKVETFEKWTEEIVKSATPIVNAWRSKIPELKENLIKLKNATDDAERKRLADEQAAKAKTEEDRRLADVQQNHMAAGVDLSAKRELDKLSNAFVEQAAVQQVGDTGPTKLVLRFTDQKLTLKALTTIIVQCMASPKFPGIQKKKKDKLVFDEKGNPEYIEAVQWWIDFFLKNCDAHIDGTIVEEEAKVIIRK